MKRLLAIVLVVLVALGLTGCGASPSKPAASGQGAATSSPSEPAAADPFAAIPTTGVHEKAALDAVPAGLSEIDTLNKTTGRTRPDMTGATPTLYYYSLSAAVGDQITLFEVRADGKAYGLFAYPAAPDPAKLMWSPAEMNEGAFLTPAQGDRETAAVAAVKAVMDKAKPGEKADIEMHGYGFVFMKDGQPIKTDTGQVYSISLDPKGNVGSWS